MQGKLVPLRKKKTHPRKPAYTIVFGTIFLLILIFICYKLAESVVLDPGNMVIHTNLVYYDGQFSDTNKFEDTQTALYVINESDETIYANVFEFDSRGQEKETSVEIGPRSNQFIKTEGPGVVYLNNQTLTSSSTVKFSRWASFKKYKVSNF